MSNQVYSNQTKRYIDTQLTDLQNQINIETAKFEEFIFSSTYVSSVILNTTVSPVLDLKIANYNRILHFVMDSANFLMDATDSGSDYFISSGQLPMEFRSANQVPIIITNNLGIQQGYSNRLIQHRIYSDVDVAPLNRFQPGTIVGWNNFASGYYE